MNPAIQLIQLTLRVEREAEAQYRHSIPQQDDAVNEKPVRARKQNPRAERTGALLLQWQCCECA